MTTNLYLQDEIDHVQGQIGRADTKASILTGLALAALTGGTALAAKAHLHGFAAAGAILTGCLIVAALVLLGSAIRPALGGNHGFMRWATTPDASTLHRDLHKYVSYEDRAHQLWLLARSAHTKYRRIQLAVDLLGAAIAGTALTATFTGLGW